MCVLAVSEKNITFFFHKIFKITILLSKSFRLENIKVNTFPDWKISLNGTIHFKRIFLSNQEI